MTRSKMYGPYGMRELEGILHEMITGNEKKKH